MSWQLLHTLRWPIVILVVSLAALLTPWMRKQRSRQQLRKDSLIAFRCSSCNRPLLVDHQLSGRKGQCKGCGAVLLIPEKSPRVPVLPESLKPALAGASQSIKEAVSLEGPQMNKFLRAFINLIVASLVIAGMVVAGGLMCSWIEAEQIS